MHSLAYLTVAGLLLTVVGACVAAWGVLLSPRQAAEIGAARYGSPNWEENLKLPMPQALLRQSRLAAWGLSIIAVGTLLQVAATLAPLITGPVAPTGG